MFGDKVRQMFNKEPKQDDAIIEQPTARTTAERALIAELSTLTAAGSGFVPPVSAVVPALDSGVWEPAQPVQAPAIAPHETPEGKHILGFVGACSCSVTRREIIGGTDLPFEMVQTLLPLLVQSGALRVVEGSENTAAYTLATATPKPTPVHEPYIHPETAWSNAARARELAKEAANRPKPTPRYEPSDAEIDTMIAAENEKRTSIVLTPEELADLRRRTQDRFDLNPQLRVRG